MSEKTPSPVPEVPNFKKFTELRNVWVGHELKTRLEKGAPLEADFMKLVNQVCAVQFEAEHPDSSRFIKKGPKYEQVTAEQLALAAAGRVQYLTLIDTASTASQKTLEVAPKPTDPALLRLLVEAKTYQPANLVELHAKILDDQIRKPRPQPITPSQTDIPNAVAQAHRDEGNPILDELLAERKRRLSGN